MPRILLPKDSSGRITSPANADTLPRKRDIAARYGVSLRTVDRWVNEKKIPYLDLGNRSIRFRWEAVERAINRLEVKEVA